MSVKSKIRKVVDETGGHIKAFIYGPPGMGKTYLAKSAADAGMRVLLLDCESGTMTIRGSDVDVFPVEKAKDIGDVLKALRGGSLDYDVIVVDSLTEFQKKLIDHYSKDRGQEGMNQKLWGIVIDKTRNMVRNFRDLPMHVIVLALSTEIEEEVDGANRILHRPNVNGKKLPAELGGFFDLVGYAMKHKGQHGILFSAKSNRIVTKDRSGKLDAFEPNNFAIIKDKVLCNTSSESSPESSTED